MKIPEASRMTRQCEQPDSVRGLIVFSANDYFYVVEAEMNTMSEEVKFGPLDSRSFDSARITAQ